MRLSLYRNGFISKFLYTLYIETQRSLLIYLCYSHQGLLHSLFSPSIFFYITAVPNRFKTNGVWKIPYSISDVYNIEDFLPTLLQNIKALPSLTQGTHYSLYEVPTGMFQYGSMLVKVCWIGRAVLTPTCRKRALWWFSICLPYESASVENAGKGACCEIAIVRPKSIKKLGPLWERNTYINRTYS